ncbi:MAG: hypothetical protein PUI41_08340 [Lachnospiraceae bacterium]|nr:hypothetical protein [Lachnospiraceae bacterium]MCI7596299.1 hypothetical protein [Lachnospiraceae bacterium]MDD7050908.1 hypothetical protein [Lachnospiraceae bacterium]MDY3222563.1 hypothetical protein [Lachnospiraceae bacterium]MDY4097243.1 hypothetical protein [Lachnospiraceae bacterium]
MRSGDKPVKEMKKEIKMTVSPICAKEGKKYAFVAFADGSRTAEGKIPDCKILSNVGFSKSEVEQLEAYMRSELEELKKLAAGIRLIDALQK